MAKKKIVAVVISKDPVEWRVPEIPCVNYTEGYEYFPHFPRLKTRFRIEYLARRRNGANKKAIELHPDLTHFFSVDSYYLDDVAEIRKLVTEYKAFGEDVILGASTWYRDRSRIFIKHWYWDTWTNPEFLGKTPEYYPPPSSGVPPGWQETKGSGGFTISPRWVWEKQQYGIPEPFPESGCEANYLSRCEGAKTYISFNVQANRDPPEEMMMKPFVNRVRTSLAIGTRMRKLGIPDVSWIVWNRVLQPRRRMDWLRSTIECDGLKWKVRGIQDSYMAYSGHEEWLKKEILQKGKLFVDIGAHVGTWSVRGSQYYERVIAFEPTQQTRKILLKNININEISNVEVVAAALGSKRSMGTMHRFSNIRGYGGNSLETVHPIMGGKGEALNNTVVEPLDDFSLSPDLVKIDTEGYELPILNGASETLKRTRRIIVESHRDEDVLRIRDMLNDSGFKTRLVVSPSEVHVVGER